MRAGPEAGSAAQLDLGPAGAGVAVALALRRRGAEAHRPGEQRGGPLVGFEPERDAEDAADGVLGRHRRRVPAGGAPGVVEPDQFQHQPVRIAEGEHRRAVAEARLRAFGRDLVPQQPLHPVADASPRHREARFRCLAGAVPALVRAEVGEEGEDGAGRAGAVAVVEMVGAGIVEIDRALHEAQAERAGVEVEVALRVGGDGRDVVDAAYRNGAAAAALAHAAAPRAGPSRTFRASGTRSLGRLPRGARKSDTRPV